MNLNINVDDNTQTKIDRKDSIRWTDKYDPNKISEGIKPKLEGPKQRQ
ncbi:hypothetical protein KPL39_07930 [Clostridium gasigenes]|nr:hypothetical protein [Clostridium gasigenes]MBU3136198.1 hypothetical protein [Clostridium gasigenes]